MNNFFVYLISSTSKRIRLKYFASPWCLQSVQHDYTAILSCLIQTFPNQLEFKDLVQLTHRHDPEMDFFENMKHIQVGAAVSPAFRVHLRQLCLLGKVSWGVQVPSLVCMAIAQMCI